MAFQLDKLREDFPSLSRIINKKPVIYLDNACMTLKPRSVIEAIVDYYFNFPGCHGRTNHHFGAETTEKYENSRKKFQKFLNAAHSDEIIFLRNATEGLNLLAHILPLAKGDIIFSSDIEHNSNLLPWQAVEKKKGIQRIIISTLPDTSFDLNHFRKKLTSFAPRVKLVSILSHSNLTGVAFPVRDIIEASHQAGALVCVDAAQSALSHPLDVRAWDVDFLVLSVHKMWGPTGIGILYGKKSLLESLPQFLTGGETVVDTTHTSATLAGLPDKFEAGLQDYAGVIGAGVAVDYIRKVGKTTILNQVIKLNHLATEKIKQIPGVSILGPQDHSARNSILNFIVDGLNVSDAAKILNESRNIMVRSGKHCVHSFYNSRKISDSLRISFSAYNTFTEIDAFIDTFKQIIKYFR